MSILACITVVECDHCKRTVTLQSELEYETFEATWYDSLNHSFCANCRELDLPSILDAVTDDRAMTRAISRAVRKYGAREVVDAG